MRETIDLVYCIDLDTRIPEVLEFSGKALKDDLKHFKTSDPMDLEDFDRKIFFNELAADDYLKRYQKMLSQLPRLPMPMSYPSLLLKRHYLVQTALGEKTKTIRHYKKDWKIGSLFYFHDQTFYVTCRILKIAPTETDYRYDFELARLL